MDILMDDLITFLRDRLDEDEALANASSGNTWVARRTMGTGYFVADEHNVAITRLWVELDELVEGPQSIGSDPLDTAKHIALHDPARVLREVASKRKIIDRASDWTSNEYEAWPVLAMLALAYADHPDYQQDEWKP